jgi:hypothetical protein
VRAEADQHFFDLAGAQGGGGGQTGAGGQGGQAGAQIVPPATVPRVFMSSFFIEAILKSGSCLASRSQS